MSNQSTNGPATNKLPAPTDITKPAPPPVKVEIDARGSAPKPAAGMSVQVVPLKRIYVPYGWNARSLSDVLRVVPEDEKLAGFDPLVESTGLGGGGEKTEPGLIDQLKARGQDKPVDLRPNPDPKTNDKQDLTPADGFRRITALTKIAEAACAKAAESKEESDYFPIKSDPKWDARNPTVLAIIKPMSEYEARERNLTSATTANKLTAPDLAYGLKELEIAAKEAGEKLNGAQIAARIGVSPALVSTLLKIMRLPKKITKHWRECGKITLDGKDYISTVPTYYKEMLSLVEGEHDNVEKEYAKLLVAREPGGKPKNPEAKKLESACARAASIGELIGYLAFVGVDVQKITKGEWDKIVTECVGFTRLGGKEATESQQALLIAKISEAYKAEKRRLLNPEDGDAEDNEETAQTKRDKRDGGR